jgi:hypothetical protein
MEWTPSIAADLSRYGCPECSGTGLPGRGKLSVCQPAQAESVPQGDQPPSRRNSPPDSALRLCTCVYRAVFRACYRRFMHCGKLDPSLRTIRYQRTPGAVDRSLTWVRRNEDFRADFHSCGQRALPRHFYQFFSFYYLHGAKIEIVCRRLGISVRRARDWMAEIETVVGREIAHLQPYSLFPPRGYMMPAGRARRSDEGLRRTG